MTPHQPPFGHYVDLETRDAHVVRCYVAEPLTPPTAAVVVLQHKDQRYPAEQVMRSMAPGGLGRTGVNPHVRQMAESFAAQGYLAIAPSTFGRGRSGVDYGYRFETRLWRTGLAKPLQALESPLVMLNIEAALGHARRLSPHQRVFVTGYCWGALLAWRAACELAGIDAAVCHYPGGIDGEADRRRQPQCPTLIHLPGDGVWLSRQGLQAFVAAQSQAATGRAPVYRPTIHHYDAAYGFMQPQGPAYDDYAAQLAHGRTLDFLHSQTTSAAVGRAD